FQITRASDSFSRPPTTISPSTLPRAAIIRGQSSGFLPGSGNGLPLWRNVTQPHGGGSPGRDTGTATTRHASEPSWRAPSPAPAASTASSVTPGRDATNDRKYSSGVGVLLTHSPGNDRGRGGFGFGGGGAGRSSRRTDTPTTPEGGFPFPRLSAGSG